MPLYHKLGKIPPKRHTQFKKPNGEFYYEQLFGTIGFDGMSSLMYHMQRPTQVKEILNSKDVSPKAVLEKNMRSLKLIGFNVAPEDDFLDSRKTMLFNKDCHISLASPKKSITDYFYKNVDADELLFIHKGSGTLKTIMGEIPFEYGDYLVIPRGVIYQIEFDSEENLLNCVKLLKWSDERLQRMPELLNMWCWYKTYREGMNIYFSTWWWNQPYFEERNNAFLERSHQGYLEKFGATQDDVTVEHEIVGQDKPFHYWIDE